MSFTNAPVYLSLAPAGTSPSGACDVYVSVPVPFFLLPFHCPSNLDQEREKEKEEKEKEKESDC